MRLLRPALALLLATTLCVSGLPSASAVPFRMRGVTHDRPLKATKARVAGVAPSLADNTLIVRFKGRLTPQALTRAYRAADTTAGAVSVIRGDVLSWRVPSGTSVTRIAEKLERTGLVAYAEPNYLRQLARYTPPAYVEPNDPAYVDTDAWGRKDSGNNWVELYPRAKSWWIRDVKGVPAWTIGYTGPDISGKYPLRSDGDAFKVGIIDTGVYLSHPDRSAYMIAGSANVEPVDPSQGPYQNYDDNVDEVAHGTCVAGIIGAATGNGVGTLGVGNDTKVAMYKVYFGGDGIDDAAIINALRQATDDGCKVINMSIAGGPYNQALQDAIDYAWNRGCVIVAASGNNSASTVSYPAAMNHVVAVGALGKNGAQQTVRASYSNYGSALAITAPGSWVWGLTKPGYTDPDNGKPGYEWWDGTSMASPLVAGSIAWLWRAMPSLSNKDVVDLIENTATDLGAPGRDDLYGHGELDVNAAYNVLKSGYPLLDGPTLSVTAAADGQSAEASWTAVSGYQTTYDVSVDGSTAASSLTGTSTTVSLTPKMVSLQYRRGQLLWSHTPADGQHTIAITPRSPRNWADGHERTESTITVPGGSPHVDRVSIDGAPATDTAHGSMSTSALALGQHQAIVQFVDNLGYSSQPATLTFTVRPGPTVQRTATANRHFYATALSRATFTTATTAVLVTSGSWMDALSAAPLAHVVHGPVLLTSRNTLPGTTKNELARLRVKKIIIVGNTADVSSSLKTSLAKRYRVGRISGGDQYATANGVARNIAVRSGGTVADRKVVVVGGNYACALAASAVAARKGWPLLYTPSARVPQSTRDTIHAIHATSALVVGSAVTVSDPAKSQLPSPTRITSAYTLSIPTLLANWATRNYPADFSGERIYLASSSQWNSGLALPAVSAEKGGLVLATTPSLTSPVKSYYGANSEIAVTTRVVGSTGVVANSAVNTIKGIVGAQ